MNVAIRIPREHGLIVVWINTFLLSLLLSSQHFSYGIITFIIFLSTFIVYDPMLMALRARKNGRSWMALLNRNFPYVIPILFFITGWIVFMAVIRIMPIYPLMILALVFPGYLISFWRGERSVIAQILSITTLTSLYLILVSSMTGSFSAAEVTTFLIITGLEIVIGSGPSAIMDSRIFHVSFWKSYVSRVMPIYLSVSVLIAILLIQHPARLMISIILASMFALSFPLMRSMPIKKIGALASAYNLLILVAVSFMYFSSA